MGTPKTYLSPNQSSIILDGKRVDYQLKMSSRSQRIHLTIHPETGLLVTVPQAYPLAKLEAVIREKANWIISRLQVLEKRHLARAVAAAEGIRQLRYLGQTYRLVIWLKPASPSQVEISGELALVTLPREDDLLLDQTLAAWYRRAAAEVLLPRIDYFARQMDVAYARVFFRNQKTRWGSCSGKKNLNFNIRLVMAPREIVDYLVIHELAHLKEMNHSPRFWAVVDQFCPNRKSHQHWLKEHGAELEIPTS